jgi:fluoride exporter
MYDTLTRYIAIALAGSAGAVLRYVVATLVSRFNFRFPLGTFIINITGSMFLGWFLTFITRHSVSDTTRLAIGVGFVGAYTTFSTYMWESNKLLEEGAGYLAMLNIIGSLVVGLLAVRLGIMMARGN